MPAKFKEKIKGLLPKGIVYYYYLLSAHRAANYDLKRRVRAKLYNSDSADRLKRDLTLLYHIVEKGLTMPVTRPGFGKNVVMDLCSKVLLYTKKKLSVSALEFVQAVSSLREYADFHTELGFELDADLKDSLSKVLERFPDIEGQKQLDTDAAAYFAQINAPFDVFCKSRYSVRNYTAKEIPLELIYRCIELAQKSPSFCNRQPTRVHIVKSAEKKSAVLALQNGNRGFGHLAETLLVLSSDILTTKDIHERFENHLNGGMFAMTLLNALHFNKIAACALNWSESPEHDSAIRKLLAIPDKEVVLMIISCGFPPDNFRLAASPRKKAEEITTVHM
ncbi:MAG: nitroreductase family protein [Bacteroidales bacterium]|nr:nitroreductase family protein [Bacteroidales bacterium]